jgi:hypothetical protein
MAKAFAFIKTQGHLETDLVGIRPLCGFVDLFRAQDAIADAEFVHVTIQGLVVLETAAKIVLLLTHHQGRAHDHGFPLVPASLASGSQVVGPPCKGRLERASMILSTALFARRGETVRPLTKTVKATTTRSRLIT